MSAIPADGGGAAEDCARSRSAKRDHNVRIDRLQLALQPLAARGDLHLVGFLVYPPFATRLELEMLDCVRHVRRPSVDARLFKRTIQQPPCRTHEWTSGEILLIPRLFTDQHDPCRLAAFAKHGPRSILPQRAVAAALRLLPGLRQRFVFAHLAEAGRRADAAPQSRRGRR